MLNVMDWTYSDGSTVTVTDGRITASGNAELVDLVTHTQEALDLNLLVWAEIGPQPYAVKLDLTEPALVDCYLRDNIPEGLEIKSAPEFAPWTQGPDGEAEYDPDVVY